MTAVPALPKETAYLYARFNKIRKISNRDFADMGEYKPHFKYSSNFPLLNVMVQALSLFSVLSSYIKEN